MYYILSLKWTNQNDLLFTFWRANARGYSWIKSEYGIYDSSEAKIHTGARRGLATAVMIHRSDADKLAVSILYEGKVRQAIPVNENTLKAFGITQDQLQQENETDFPGLEFVDNEAPSQTNMLKTTHDLDFLAAKYETDPVWTMFRVGTVHGLYRILPDALEILSIANDEPGNGHLEDTFQWFEFACKGQKATLRILEVINSRFLIHLKARGFHQKFHEGNGSEFGPVVEKSFE